MRETRPRGKKKILVAHHSLTSELFLIAHAAASASSQMRRPTFQHGGFSEALEELRSVAGILHHNPRVKCPIIEPHIPQVRVWPACWARCSGALTNHIGMGARMSA